MDRFNQSMLCHATCPVRDVAIDDADPGTSLVNPFSRKESHSSSAVITYKVLTLLTWVLSVVVSIYYSVRSPADELKYGRTLAGQNALHPSGFSLNFPLLDVYLYVLRAPPLSSQTPSR